MSEIRIGDIVARKSYGYDVFFKVVDIRSDGTENIVTLKGISYRIQADAPESDLELQSDRRINEYRDKCDKSVEKAIRNTYVSKQQAYPKKAYYRNTPKESTRKFSRPGKVLHIDGDNDYLEICMSEYRKQGMDVAGKFISEKDQVSAVFSLLQENKPDILVLTGHDGVLKGSGSYLNLANYRNSRYFIEGVKEARKFERDLDSLVIFAGACQSMYNEIIKAGANFASSPCRVLIHALDPVFICRKIAFTGIDKVIEPIEAISSTMTGSDGIGGLQTRGKYRDGFPLESFSS